VLNAGDRKWQMTWRLWPFSKGGLMNDNTSAEGEEDARNASEALGSGQEDERQADFKIGRHKANGARMKNGKVRVVLYGLEDSLSKLPRWNSSNMHANQHVSTCEKRAHSECVCIWSFYDP
jgi:hypothetical protein